MGRNRLRQSLSAAILGGILGFLAPLLPELGWLLVGATAAAAIALYVSQHRMSDVGWLLLAGGGVPALILGRNGFVAIVDPSVEVGVDTWIMLLVMLLVASVGGLVLYAASGEKKQSDRP